MLKVQDLRRLVYAAVNLSLIFFAQIQTERNILIHIHMRIERIILEHHRNVAVLWRYLVHKPVADIYFTFRDGLKPRDHTQSGGLPASRRAYQDNEFLILDLQVQIRDNRRCRSIISLCYIFKTDRSHNHSPPSYFSLLFRRSLHAPRQ